MMTFATFEEVFFFLVGLDSEIAKRGGRRTKSSG